mmetsp:Transcript_22674/g.33477  ORF Transcript_22674/g.33477 Transcript_22674/m.33477 type:complete len:203 (+) Transcript_22674:285-893(+)
MNDSLAATFPSTNLLVFPMGCSRVLFIDFLSVLAMIPIVDDKALLKNTFLICLEFPILHGTHNHSIHSLLFLNDVLRSQNLILISIVVATALSPFLVTFRYDRVSSGRNVNGQISILATLILSNHMLANFLPMIQILLKITRSSPFLTYACFLSLPVLYSRKHNIFFHFMRWRGEANFCRNKTEGTRIDDIGSIIVTVVQWH